MSATGEQEQRRLEALEEGAAKAIEAAEEVVLRVAAEQRPASLQELRNLVAHEEGGLDPSLLRAAIWRLLNANRLQLTSDRKLEIA